MATADPNPPTMKALYLTKDTLSSAPHLSLTALPVQTPSPGSLLVRVTASLINPSDILNSSGAFPLTSYPRIPGRDFAGVVVSEGPRKGERVYGTSGSVLGFSQDGSHAEHIVVPEFAVHKIPDSMGDVSAAMIGVPFTTALIALRRANAQAGETVLILGSSGAVGSAAVQVANALGCRVLRAARNATGTNAVDLKSDNPFDLALSLTNGKGASVIFDTVGIPSITSSALSALAVHGRLVFIAAPRKGSTEMGFKMDLLYRKQQAILGCNSLLYGLEETGKMVGELGQWFEEGKLEPPKTEGVERIGLQGAFNAYGEMKAGGRRKFVIVMDGEKEK